jgi:hypothetical protein
MTSQWLVLVVSCRVSGLFRHNISWVSTRSAFEFRNYSYVAQLTIKQYPYPGLSFAVWLTTTILGHERTYVNQVSFFTYTFIGLPSKLALSCWLGQVCWVLRVFLVAPLPPRPGVEHFDNLHNGPPRLSPQALKYTLRALV